MLIPRSVSVAVQSRTWPPGPAIFRRYSGTTFDILRLIPTSNTGSSHAQRDHGREDTHEAGIYGRCVVSHVTLQHRTPDMHR